MSQRKINYHNNIKYKSIFREVDASYVTPETLKEGIDEACEGLINPYFELSAYNNYGDEALVLGVTGFVERTKEEIAEERQKQKDKEKLTEDYQRKQYEALRKKFENGH